MKKLLLPLFIGLSAISAQAQVANGDFESWTKVMLFEHPYTGFTDMSSNYDTFFDNGELSVTKVQQEDDNTVLRIENVMGSNEVMPGYFIFGKTPTDGLVFGGGNPIYDLNMTGIAMDIKFDMRDETEGFVIVQFKDGDTPVGMGNHSAGTYVFPISGTEDWSNKEFEFDYPVHPSANRCVVGLASADLINNDAPFVEGSFIEVDNIEFIDSQSSIAGADFETWLQVDPIMVPDDCVVETDALSPNYSLTWDAYEGLSAIKLKTIEREGDDLSAGYVLMANKDENGEIVPTIEIDQHDILSFAYAYQAAGDMGQAKFIFYDESNNFEQVFEYTLELSPNEEYELVDFPYRDMLQEMEIVATHMSIEFKSSIETAEIPAQLGSTLLIDDVNLQSALGFITIKAKKTVIPVRAYPNPTIGRVAFTFPGPRSGYYRVFNHFGSQIAVREFSSTKEVVFDLMPYSRGKYLFQFHHNSGVEFSRVIKL